MTNTCNCQEVCQLMLDGAEKRPDSVPLDTCRFRQRVGEQLGDPLGKLNSPTAEDELDREIEEGRRGLIPQSPQEQRAVQALQSSQHAWHALQVERVRQISKGYTPDIDDAKDIDDLTFLAHNEMAYAYRTSEPASVEFDLAKTRASLIRAGAVIAATLASMERRGL